MHSLAIIRRSSGACAKLSAVSRRRLALSARYPTVRKMMTSSETSEVENSGGEKGAEDSAILEVSSMAVGGIMKQESRDVDYLSNCSTSIEGSVVRA